MYGKQPLPNGTSAFAVRDRTLLIATDAPFVERFVRRSYGRLRISPDEHGVRPLDSGAIVTSDDGFRLIFDGREQPWPIERPARDAWFRAAFYGSRELFRLSAARLESCWPLYGAGIALGSKAVVVLGPSGAGKTTLALALLARGARFYGDECIFIDRASGIVDGLARSLMIRERSLGLLSSVRGLRSACERNPFQGQAPTRVWYAIDPDEVFSRAVSAAPSPLAAVLILEDRTSDQPMMTLLPNSMAAVLVSRHSHVKAVTLGEIAKAGKPLSGVACYRLRPGTPADTAALVVTTLEGAA
ncbi:MAG: hypothetical protein NVSMB64_16720 [Candidatus Velthaea sp.]